MDDELDKRLNNILSKVKSIKFTKHHYFLALLAILINAFYIRTRNLRLLQGKYLSGIDPYFFYRYTKIIVEQGALPIIDYMRYSPVGFTTVRFAFFPKSLAYMYKFITLFSDMSLMEWIIIYPPIITIISFVFFFLLVKELLGYKNAVLSTLLLSIFPAYIFRTSAGFADHEAMAMLWMFLSIYLFVLMWKSKNLLKNSALGALSGIFCAAMLLTWGGYSYLLLSISLFLIISSIMYKIPKNKFIGVIFFYIPFALSLNYYQSNTIWSTSVFTSIQSLSLLAFFAIYLLTGIIDSVKAKVNINSLNKIPTSFLSILVLALVNIYRLSYFKNLIVNKLIGVRSSRFATTVSVYSVYSLFLLTYIFSSSGKTFFENLYMPLLIITILTYFIVHYLMTKQDAEQHILKTPKYSLLFILSWFLLTILTSKDQTRLLFMVAPIAAITASFFIWEVAEKIPAPSKNYRRMIFIILIAVLISPITSLNAQSLGQNKYVGSMVPGQWESAMSFLREQTPDASVVAHWWDYGHLTIGLGERAAVTDGGNLMGWNHQSGRHLMTDNNLTTSLEYLKTHKVNYVLFSRDEIGKYHAFSLIGSDENLDRYSTIGTFGLVNIKEVRDGNLYTYQGSWSFDKDYEINGLILPSGKAAISGFSYTVTQNNTIEEPVLHVVYNGKAIKMEYNCLQIDNERVKFETEDENILPGCIKIIPYLEDGDKIVPFGAALWTSEKVVNGNFARLYIYNSQEPEFELVYEDNTPLAIYKGRIIGPIKIWEVNYPDWVEEDSYYLEKSEHG
jgi:asparagine N-glycosylation enzyme membrane subunit Stt3